MLPLSRVVFRFVCRAALTLLVASCIFHASAQSKSAAPVSRVEIFGGYTYVYPHAVISGVQPGGTLPIMSCLCGDVRGGGASATYNFNRWIGLTGDFSGSSSSAGSTVSSRVGKANFFSYSVGPEFTFRSSHFAPFAEVLFGGQRLSPSLFAPSNAFGFLAGGGLDLSAGRHLAIRLFRADYILSNHQISPAPTPTTDIRGLRLEAGVVFLLGGHHNAAPAPAPSEAAVARAPSSIAAPLAAPEVQPLTLSLVATPAVLVAGESSTIVANAISPGSRPLTFKFETSGGTLSGSGPTVQLATAGMAAGKIQVTGEVSDDQGQTATALTSVTLTSRPVTAIEQSRALCTMSFARDKRRPVRVDNEAKACLDEIALTLQRDSNAQLVMVGNTAAGEIGGKATAAQRAVDAKEYLVIDKGIETSRIILYTGDIDARSVETTIVPHGANYDASAKASVDEHSFKARPRARSRQ